MQKTLKRITVILAILTAVLCLGVFASACQGGKKDTYTVTVVYAEDNSPVDGTALEMNIQICKALLDGTYKGCFDDNFKVGADGKAEVKFPELKKNLQYHLQVNNVPEGYEYHEDETFMTEPGTLTIKLYKV